MRVVRDEDASRFLAKVGPLLERSAAENNLMLGLLADLQKTNILPGLAHEPGVGPAILLSIESESGVEAVALQTPPRGLVLSRASEEAIAELVAFACAAPLELPGVVGPAETAARFASMWAARTGGRAALRLDEMVYELERVTPPAGCGGHLREARVGDDGLLAVWLEAFNKEAGVHPLADCLAFVRGKIAARELFVWDDGAPVSMVAWSGRTAVGVRVNYVYTPPALRKRGYASAVVAALSERLLAQGNPRCYLFTNAANPTSNKIYQAIGYTFVCDFQVYDFASA